MRYFVIDLSNQLDMYDSTKNHLTFVYENADPTHSLGLDSFFYINSFKNAATNGEASKKLSNLSKKPP